MRLFVAIELPERVRTAVENLTVRARKTLPPARWVRSTNLHLTLCFLGEVLEARLAALADTLSLACSAHSRFDLQLAGAGCFPPRGRARVAWIGLRRSTELERLQGAVAGGLRSAIALEPEGRPFHAHLTVARCAPPWPPGAGRSWAASLAGGLGESFPVRDVALIQSRLGRGGPDYATLQRFPLGEAP